MAEIRHRIGFRRCSTGREIPAPACDNICNNARRRRSQRPASDLSCHWRRTRHWSDHRSRETGGGRSLRSAGPAALRRYLPLIPGILESARVTSRSARARLQRLCCCARVTMDVPVLQLAHSRMDVTAAPGRAVVLLEIRRPRGRSSENRRCSAQEAILRVESEPDSKARAAGRRAGVVISSGA